MRYKLILSICILISCRNGFAQLQVDSLFSSKSPLDLAISMSIKEVRKSKEDTVYQSHKLFYYNGAGKLDSMRVGLKGRGNFRLRECYYPPLWMSFEKKKVKGTPFEGNKKIKVVLPCHGNDDGDNLIIREYLCYTIFEVISPYSIKSRLANIDITELRNRKSKTYKVKAILLEDMGKMAKRMHAKETKTSSMNPTLFDDTSCLRFDLFQYLISNTDVSSAYEHNSKVIYKNPKYIPVPYDFDMSGVVDAPYAVVSKIGDVQLPIDNVRQRYYRGYCRPDSLTEFIRQEFISKKDKILGCTDELNGLLSEKEIREIRSYLAEFFDILVDDKSFKRQVLSTCRKL
ncbi:MAG: hypothetical protein C5B52_13820 [Bacteroidetes bacterium]|nr:MAG: hypothetical protein C5B52_13820 [Bacteroidota bacterium]